MAVSYAAFVAEFTEFSQVTQSVVEAKLTDAATRCAASAFGDLRDMAIKYLAAHMLASSPSGEMARLVSKDGSTTYQMHFEQIRMQIPLRCGVAGGVSS